MTHCTTRPVLVSSLTAGDDVFLAGDTVTVIDDDGPVTRQQVSGLGAFVAHARALRCGWGQFPDGREVIYLYDRGDDNFGYAVNLAAPAYSEWDYAPIAR